MNHLTTVIRNYVPLALRTELNPPGMEGELLALRRLRHAALGFTTETAEFCFGHDKVNLLEELGDLAWYLSVATDVLRQRRRYLKLNEGPIRIRTDCSIKEQLESNRGHMVRLSGALCDHVKRWEYYGRTPDWGKVQFDVSHAWLAVIKATALLGGDFQQVLDANVTKLKVRYPEKFSCELAVKRNVIKERTVLEKGLRR